MEEEEERESEGGASICIYQPKQQPAAPAASPASTTVLYGTGPACTIPQRTDEQLSTKISTAASDKEPANQPTLQPLDIPSTLQVQPSNPPTLRVQRCAHAPFPPYRPVPEPEPDQASITLGRGWGACYYHYGTVCGTAEVLEIHATYFWTAGSQLIMAIPVLLTGPQDGDRRDSRRQQARPERPGDTRRHQERGKQQESPFDWRTTHRGSVQ